jgi:integrase
MWATMFYLLVTTGIRLGEVKKVLRQCESKTEGRNLVIHSLRHTANTIYRKVLPDEVLQKFTGHSSKEMTDNYDHRYNIVALKLRKRYRKRIQTNYRLVDG